MATIKLPDQDTLLQLISADLESGHMLWRPRTEAMFSSVRAMRAWNSKNAGKPALNSPAANGYLRGRLCGVGVYAHRVIWKIATGEEPDILDHINRDVQDNRICNLRPADKSLNALNTQKHQFSGTWASVHRTGFYASIGREYLGLFQTQQEAADAYREAFNTRMSSWGKIHGEDNTSLDRGHLPGEPAR